MNERNIPLTPDQKRALEQIREFISSPLNVFILEGYAGTGKTTILQELAKTPDLGNRMSFMAPTGRAARVIRQRTGLNGSTIHKAIYDFTKLNDADPEGDPEDTSFKYYFAIRGLIQHDHKIYIVDEASMISDTSSENEFFRFGSGHLLTDLIEFTRIGHPGVRSKLIFVGDPAQLPPIDMNFSPALDPEYLRTKFSVTVTGTRLTEVIRQSKESGILKLATTIREDISLHRFSRFDPGINGTDIRECSFVNMLDEYMALTGLKVLITYSNKNAGKLNRDHRIKKYGSDLPIQKGDLVIVTRNNYSYGLFNGDFARVRAAEPGVESRTIALKKKGGQEVTVPLSWRNIELEVRDEDGNLVVVQCKMLESLLTGDDDISSDEMRALYVDFIMRHRELPRKSEVFSMALKSDPYFNALWLKYGYAITCHKAQGGEWDHVIIYWDYARGEQIPVRSAKDPRGRTHESFFRWAYTAITRARMTIRHLDPPQFNAFSALEFSFPAQAPEHGDEQHSEQTLSFDVVLDKKMEEHLASGNMQDVPGSIRDHYLLMYAIGEHIGAELVSSRRISYEFQYYFARKDETACIKCWVNRNNVFGSRYDKFPGGTNSDKLYNEIRNILEQKPSIRISGDLSPSSTDVVDLTMEGVPEHHQGSVRMLFQAVTPLVQGSGIRVTALKHHPFSEHYSFSKGGKTATLVFYFNSKGQFTNVSLAGPAPDASELLTTLAGMIERLKYAH